MSIQFWNNWRQKEWKEATFFILEWQFINDDKSRQSVFNLGIAGVGFCFVVNL